MKTWITALCSLLLSTAALAQPAKLLGPDLEPTTVTLKSWSPELIRVTDRHGKAMDLTHQQVLRLSFDTPQNRPAQTDAAIATLVDGQVLVGKLLGPGEDSGSIRMALSFNGREIDLKLDRLLSLVLKRGARPTTAEDDVLLLATGETLVGFVDAIGDEAVQFIVGDADEPIPVPLDRVHALSIANPPQPPRPEPGQRLVRITLRDGTTLLLTGATTTPDAPDSDAWLTGESVLAADRPKLSLALGQVMRLEPLSSRFALAPLGQQPMQTRGGGEVFGVPMPPRLTADGELRLHAPTTLGFELPEGARRLTLSASLALPEDLPADRRTLAGCTLVVYDGDKQVGETQLRPDRPPQRLNVPLTTGELRIQARPGINGPVLDRVRITDAELMIERP